MNILINQFYTKISGQNVQVYVYADNVTGAVTYQTENTGFHTDTRPIPTSFLDSFCNGLDLYSYYAQDADPYAYLERTLNSSACGYNPSDPGTPLSATATSTDETAFQANDGTVTLDITGGDGPYLYALNGVSYQPYSGTITGLAPGDYTVSIEDQNGIRVNVNFTINAFAAVFGCTDPTATNYDPSATQDNGTCIYIVNDDDKRQNIYETTDEFRLIDKAGNIFVIEMPRGWEKITMKLARDEQYHGVNYDFSDGSVSLDFDIAAGKDILDAEYDKNGNDGFMQFQFGEVYPDGTFYPDIDAFIDFDQKQKDRDFFTAGIKKKVFNDAIETKNEIDVKILDGYITMPMHSKQIKKQTIINRQAQSSGLNNLGTNVVSRFNGNPNGSTDISYQLGQPKNDYRIYWTFLDFSQPATTDPAASSYINDLATEPPLFGATQSNPIQVGQYLFKTDGSGSFTFNFDFSLQFKTKVTQSSIQTGGTPNQGKWSYAWFLCVNDFSPANRHILSFVGGSVDSIYVYANSVTKANVTLNLNQGDEVYLFGQYVSEYINEGTAFEGTILANYTNINIVGNTLAAPTTAQTILVYELMQSILNNISGGTAKLVSNLLGRTDLGYNEDGCAALIAYTNGYLIRNFLLTDRPLTIQLKDLIEGLDTNYCIGMGYELNDLNQQVYRIEQAPYFYQDVLIMTFSDVQDYKEPIDTKLIYNQWSFGFDKYTQDLQDVSTMDEFLTEHDYQTPIESYKATLSRICKQIAAGYAIELTKRQQYSVDPQKSWTYDEDNFMIAVVRDQQYGFRPEKLENFTASGILSPETAYNIRFTITRMLERWAPFLNSGLAYKNPSATIVNTYTSKNGDLTSQYTGDQACESKQQFTEAHNLVKGDLNAGNQLFFPDSITFTTKLSWQDIKRIRRCFTNKDTEGANNGYFGVIDGDGNTQYGFLMSMEYNPLNENVQFVLRKKYVDLSQPFDCSQYTFYTFGQFEAETGLPKEIEQCLFENFA